MKLLRNCLFLLMILGLLLPGCSDPNAHTRGVYMLLDTSGTYANELKKAQNIISYLLATLLPGDSLVVARIDSGSFSEKDIIHKITFDARPSVTVNQKRVYAQKIDDFVKTVTSSSYTDISGGILQAIDYLNEIGANQKTILIFSDLEEELAKGQVRDLPYHLEGFRVVALNVTKLRSDNIDPREYLDRQNNWRSKVENGGGNFSVINDLERLEKIVAD